MHGQRATGQGARRISVSSVKVLPGAAVIILRRPIFFSAAERRQRDLVILNERIGLQTLAQSRDNGRARAGALRDWYRIAQPQGWLFPGQDPIRPMTTRQLTRACHTTAHMAEISKRVTPHTLRHSFSVRARHCLALFRHARRWLQGDACIAPTEAIAMLRPYVSRSAPSAPGAAAG
jgi:hypothetical protein